MNMTMKVHKIFESEKAIIIAGSVYAGSSDDGPERTSIKLVQSYDWAQERFDAIGLEEGDFVEFSTASNPRIEHNLERYEDGEDDDFYANLLWFNVSLGFPMQGKDSDDDDSRGGSTRRKRKARPGRKRGESKASKKRGRRRVKEEDDYDDDYDDFGDFK